MSDLLLQVDFIKNIVVDGSGNFEDWNLIISYDYGKFSQVCPFLADNMIVMNKTHL